MGMGYERNNRLNIELDKAIAGKFRILLNREHRYNTFLSEGEWEPIKNEAKLTDRNRYEVTMW